MGDRLRDAIPDIRVVTRDDLRKLSREIDRLGKRLDRLEKQLAKQPEGFQAGSPESQTPLDLGDPARRSR